MSEQKSTKKPKYETPTVVPLGGLAQGIGYCTSGSSANPGYCTTGHIAAAACTDGSLAGAACTNGNTASGACTGGGNLYT